MEKVTLTLAFNRLIEENCHLKYDEDQILYSDSDSDHDYALEETLQKRIKISNIHNDECTCGQKKNNFSFDADRTIRKLLHSSAEKGIDFIIIVHKYLSSKFKIIIDLHRRKEHFHRILLKVADFLRLLSKRGILDFCSLSNKISNGAYVNSLPFVAIGELVNADVLSWNRVIDLVKHTTDGNRLRKECMELILNGEEGSNGVVGDYLSALVGLSLELPLDEYIKLKNVSNDMLSDLTKGILDALCLDSCKSPSKTKTSGSLRNKSTNFYEFILNSKSLHHDTISKYFSSQLIFILNYDPASISLSTVIQEQNNWRSTNINVVLSSFFETIISCIGAKEALSVLDRVVSSLEVNWGFVLTLLVTILVYKKESSTQVRALISSYISAGCEKYERDEIILGLLFARHASQEGPHIFPPYGQWFAATFGAETSSPANNKHSFAFFIRVLNDLVPYENRTILNAHISQSIFIPKGNLNVYREYQNLVRAHLKDFTIDAESRESDEASKDVPEVHSAIKMFSLNKKVPSFVIESSIFNKHFFSNVFLPDLLRPRVLSGTQSAIDLLIGELVSLGKIPDEVYNSYLNKCKEKELVDSFSSDCVNDEVGKYLDNLESLLEVLVADEDGNEMEGKNLKILSKISKIIEEVTLCNDKKYKNTSHLNISRNKFRRNSILFKIIMKILQNVRSLSVIYCAESEISSSRPSVTNFGSQLVVILATSFTIQEALFSSLMNCIESGASADQDEVELYGLFLAHLVEIEGVFLPCKFKDSEKLPMTPSEFILNHLQLNSPVSCFISCSLISHWIEYSPKPPIRALKFYALLAPRIAATFSECVHQIDIDFIAVSRDLHCHYGKVPKCCSLYYQKYDDFSRRASFEEFVEFEIQTPWADVQMDIRLRHLNDQIIQYRRIDSKFDQFFSRIFIILVQETLNKTNSTEFLLLLPRLATRDSQESLLTTWKNWKNELNPMNEGTKLHLYYTQLSIFMNLCLSLPSSLFLTGLNLMHIVPQFGAFVKDILICEGSNYMSPKCTSLLLEALLNSAGEDSASNIAVLQCLAPIKASIIYHWDSVCWLMDVYRPAVQSHNCLSSFLLCMRSVFNKESLMILTEADASVLILAYTEGRLVHLAESKDKVSFTGKLVNLFGSKYGLKLLYETFMKQLGFYIIHSLRSSFSEKHDLNVGIGDSKVKCPFLESILCTEKLGNFISSTNCITKRITLCLLNCFKSSDFERNFLKILHLADIKNSEFSAKFLLIAGVCISLEALEGEFEASLREITKSHIFSLLVYYYTRLTDFVRKINGDSDEDSLLKSNIVEYLHKSILKTIQFLPIEVLSSLNEYALMNIDDQISDAIKNKIS